MSGALVRRTRAAKCALAALCIGACSVYDESLLSDGGATTAGGAGASVVGGAAHTSGDAAGGSAAAGPSPSGGSGLAATGGAAAGGEVGGAISAGGAAADAGASGQAGEGGQDGTPDTCPDDPDKVVPGNCGCGIPEVDTSAVAACQTIVRKLTHRYDFEGSGTAVQDRVGSAHGVLKGASLSKLDGRGVALLGGGSAGAYVDLPNRLLSSLTNATLEAWVTWGGGSAWQRVFDFGDSTDASPENKPGLGRTYLMLTPRSASGAATIGFSLTGNSSGQEQDVGASLPLSTSLAQVVVVASAADKKLRLYIDGKKAVEAAWSGPLSAINDVNAWLGRSQYDGDPELSGVFHEFRLYGSALSDAEVMTDFLGGPDPAFLAY